MSGKIFIKPAVEDAIVLQPDRDMKRLEANGEWVVDSMHWRRLIINGDVVIAKPPHAPKKEGA
jgi:hypothetical protein